VILLKLIGYIVFAMWITWGGYLMMMPLKRNIHALNGRNKLFGYPWFAIFICLDTVFNVIFGTIIFLKLPQDVLLTQRLERYISDGSYSSYSWRSRLAYYFCTRFLDQFDPDGYHCKKKWKG
jgi:hypothetical protein